MKERTVLRETFVTSVALNIPIAAIMWGGLFMKPAVPGVMLSDLFACALAIPVLIHCGRRFYEVIAV